LRVDMTHGLLKSFSTVIRAAFDRGMLGSVQPTALMLLHRQPKTPFR
jgi:hypothetical protein